MDNNKPERTTCNASISEEHLVALFYLLMRDACPSGELVRIIKMIDIHSNSDYAFTSLELEAYARRLVKEFLC